MSGCLFCSIIAGDIPSEKVYEDDTVYAFRDISPQAPVHVLVIPKEHIGSAAQVNKNNSALVAACFEAIAHIAETLDTGDFRVVSNCGQRAGQSVSHLHFHVLAGRDMAWPPG